MREVNCVSMPKWIMTEIIGDVNNKSRRIQELIIKGYWAEREKQIREGKQ